MVIVMMMLAQADALAFYCKGKYGVKIEWKFNPASQFHPD
jgi:hypothetical protein